MRSEMPLPMPRFVMSSPIHISSAVPAGRTHPRAEPMEREDDCGEEHAAPELRDAPGIGEPGEHLLGLLLLFLLLSLLLFGLRLLGLDLGLGLFGDGLPRRSRLLDARDRLAAQPGDRAAGGLDLLARSVREAVRRDGELLRQLALAEDLDVHAEGADQPLLLEQLRGHLRARVEHALEIADVHALRERAVGPERPQGATMAPRLADPAPDLGDLDLAHSAVSAAGSGSAAAFAARGSGSTSLMVFPRMRATSSGRRRLFSACTVAFSMLIGLVV